MADRRYSVIEVNYGDVDGNDSWSIQFGDYLLSDVKQEMRDMKDSYDERSDGTELKAKHYRIKTGMESTIYGLGKYY